MAVLTHKSHTVYTRSNWADAWVAVAYLYADEFSFACGTDTSSATLQYRYGHVMRAGQQTFATYTPLSILNKYVKIAVTNGPTWYGIVVDEDDRRDGGQTIAGAEVITGLQVFLCRGLEYLLQRTPIDSSVVKDSNAVVGETTIGRAIGFNLGEGLPGSVDKLGNASTALGNAGSWVFTETLQTGIEWNATAILEYLIKIHSPRNGAGIDALGWFINRPVVNGILASFTPILQCEGKTFFQVLNELIDRRRLMSWWVYVDPNNEHPEIRVFTFTPNAIVLPGGGLIQANQDQANWDFDQENQVQTCLLATDDASRFDRVLAKGDPPGGCFTVSIQNGLLGIDWTTAQQTTYNAGDPGAAAQPNDIDAASAHQAARSKDYLKKVYRYFRIPQASFTGLIGGKAVWPFDNTLTNTCLAFWWPGLRLQDRLPLRTEHDYTTVAAVTNSMLTNSKWEYRRPFIYIYPTGERAEFLDRMSRGTVEDSPENGGRIWSCSLRMQDEAFGIIVDVHGAPAQHVIAKNTFTPVDDADNVSWAGEVDYNYMYATVFAEGDGHVTCQWPQVFIAPATDTLKELVIYVPGARLDYLVPGTTIDLGTDGVPIQSTGGFVRDDTDYLKDIARSAYEWYSTPRKSMQITVHELGFSQGTTPAGAATNLFVGSLILAVGGAANAETINSVVTKVGFDMLSGASTYLTQFAELDIT